jgi:hypothetical protein
MGFYKNSFNQHIFESGESISLLLFKFTCFFTSTVHAYNTSIHSPRFPTPLHRLCLLLFASLRLRTVNCNWQSCTELAWALALGLLELVPDGWCRHQPTDPPWNETRASEREKNIQSLEKSFFFWLNLNSIAREREQWESESKQLKQQPNKTTTWERRR